MKMDLDRFTKIVQSYGSVPVRWPEDERESAKQFLANSSEAKAMLAIEEPLDDLLMLAERKLVTHDSMETLRESVLIEISDSIPWIKRFFDWFTSDRRNSSFNFWRPTFAAALTLMAGIFIGVLVPADSDTALTTEQELYLLALSDALKEDWLYEE